MTNLFDIGANDVTAACNNDGTTNINKLNDTTTFQPVIGSWYNVVVSYHRGTVQFYLNGQLYHTKVGTGTLANLCPVSKIVVGGWWNGGENINGKLDNVRLYNRVLTPHEITTLAANYQVTSNKVRPGLKTH